MALQGNEEDNEFAGLSDAERAALADDSSDDADALSAIIGGDDEEDDEDIDADDGDDDTGHSEGDINATDTSKDDAAIISEFQPTQAVFAVDGYDEKMAEFATQKSTLRESLNNGDIDLDQYETQKDALAEQEMVLRLQQSNAENASKQNQHVAAERWQWEQDQFFNSPTNKIYSDKYLSAALNAAVIDLANDPKNVSQKGDWFLTEADKMIRAKFNQAAPIVPKKDSRRPDLSGIPKTLGNLPSAESNDTGGDEFANLDNLNGMALERALAKMTPEQVDRYLSAQ